MTVRPIFRHALWLALACAVSLAQATQAPAPEQQVFLIQGTVLSGKLPLPGVTVSAANSLTGKKVTTSTDPDGHYILKVPGRGKYVIRAELTAFAAATSEVTMNPATPQQKVDLEMTLL